MGATVMIVDDQESMRDVLVECLKFGGYEACSVSTGEEGMSMLQTRKPDLVITDVRMPGMSGYEFSKLVREACDIPIIMLSGMGQPDEAEAYTNLVDAYLSKPIGIHELLDRVETVLGRSHSDDSSAAVAVG